MFFLIKVNFIENFVLPMSWGWKMGIPELVVTSTENIFDKFTQKERKIKR